MSRLIKPSERYTIVSNHILENKKVSLKAKGLYCFLVSRPETWNFCVAGLAYYCKETRNTVNAALKELEHFGYLERILIRSADGRFADWDYQLYNEPVTKNQDMDNLYMEKPNMDNSDMKNDALISTKQINTKKENKEQTNTDREQESLSNHYCDLKKTNNGSIDDNCRNCYRINSCPFEVELSWKELYGENFLGILMAMNYYFFSNKYYNFLERKQNGILTSLEDEFDCLLDAEPELLDATYRRKAISEMREE